MKAKCAKIHCIILAGIIYFLSSVPAEGGAPTSQIKDTVDQIVVTLKNPELKSEARKNERREQLRAVIYPRFDFPEMAKRSFGSNWQRLSAEQQREFVEVFTDLLEEAYVGKIESYSGEKFLYVGETQNKVFSEVNTKVVTSKGEEFSINYKLRDVDGTWKVYDLVIENISLVNNYRSQFHRVLAQSSFDGLLRKMKEKQLQAAGKKG